MSSLRGKEKFNSEKYVNWLCILQHESSITRSVVSSNLRAKIVAYIISVSSINFISSSYVCCVPLLFEQVFWRQISVI